MAKYMNPDTDFGDDNSLNSSYISIKHITETAKKDGKDEKEIEMIIEMHKSGISIAQIATISKKTEGTIQWIIDNATVIK